MAEPLPLVPGESVGPFQLGSLLFNVLNHVRSYRSAYPSAKVAWDDEDPSPSPVHITLSSPPLHLTFSPLFQRLSRIEVLGIDPASWVSYRGKRLRASSADDYAVTGEDEDVVKTIRRVLGPTYGGSKGRTGMGAAADGEEMLSYPGVAFGVVRTGAGSTLARIVVTALPAPDGVPVEQAWLHPVLPESLAVAQGDLRVADIQLDSTRRPILVQLHFFPPASPDAPAIPPVELRIGTTTSEDILCELGAAIRTFWKEDDRLSIHTASLGGSSSDPSLDPNPYFLSYPHLGLTLLLASTTHILLKIILHSNLPGEVQFGRTARAAWALVSAEGERIGGEAGWEALRRFLGEGGQDAASGGGAAVPKKPSPGRTRVQEQGVEDLLGLSSAFGSPASMSGAGGGAGSGEEDAQKPMILDRTADGRDGVRGKTTEIHGLPGLALEVTGSGDVETLWLF
ncbi:hypothetical protein JCM10450v2_006076 [Rhodotorula kratochvilovae]